MPEKKITRKRKTAKTQIEKLVSTKLDILAESAQEAHSIAYGCRWLIMATMPYRNTNADVVERKNGDVTVQYMAGKPGLPYGPKPRLIGTWLETEIVKKRDREIYLGDTFTDFIKALGFKRSHGGNTYKSLRDQCMRLFSSTVKVTRHSRSSWEFASLQIASKARLWWNPDSPNQSSLLGNSRLIVGEEYFREVLSRPVPLDMRAITALKGSAMGLDIYRWYGARLPTISSNDPVYIPWNLVQAQLGADYQDNKEGRQNFRRKFVQQHQKVQLVYPDARVEFEPGGIVLHESAPPVPRKRLPPRRR